MFLMKYTAQGLAQLAGSASRIDQASAFVSSIHSECELISVSGDFDMITFFTGSAEDAYRLLLYLRSQGTVQVSMVRIETRSRQEYKGLLADMQRK
jgi:uncharacterized protein with GYD domain